MSQENLADNNVEQQVQSILDLGSVPMENFRTLILSNLEKLGQFISENERKVLLASLAVGLGLLASACEAPYTMADTDPQRHAEFVMSDQAIADNAAEAQQRQAEQSNQVISNAEQTKHYLPEAYPEFWQVSTEILPGEGIVAALSRAAGAQAEKLNNVPDGYVEVIIVYHNGAPTDTPPEVFDWVDLETNPIVYPDDRVTHTVLTQEGLRRLQLDYPALVIHLN